MNTKEFKVEMIRHDDTISSLAEYLELSHTTVQRKISGLINFKQDEMAKLKTRYGMSNERFVEVFYGEEVKV